MEKGYKRVRDAEILGHWHKPLDGFQTSAKEFYKAVEQAIAKRELPQVHFDRVIWKERGLLSANREYLRVEWRRYIYDMCAAPVGTGYFFSSWLCARKLKFSVWHVLGMAISAADLFLLIPTIFGPILMLAGLAFLGYQLRNDKIPVRPKAEEFLYGITIFLPIWDVLFPTLSYFEVDTASMFQGLVHSAFMESIDAVTEMKGIPRMTEMERKPVLRDFFKK